MVQSHWCETMELVSIWVKMKFGGSEYIPYYHYNCGSGGILIALNMYIAPSCLGRLYFSSFYYLPNYSRTNKLETKVICALVQKAATPPCLGSWEVEQQGKDRRGPERAPGKAQKGVWAHIKVPTWPVSSLAYPS